MKISVGLPTAVPGASAADIMHWARAGEEAGFHSLAAIDRVVYDNVEPLVALAAAAGATSTARLLTYVAIVPLRQTALFAKQVASLDLLSGGRLTLGVGLGGRADDYEVNGATTRGRGRRLEQQIQACRALWSDGSGELAGIGPKPARPGGPEIVFGGATAGIERAARLGDGWMAGPAAPFDDVPLVVSGNGPDAVPTPLADEVARLTRAWEDQGRDGRPKVLSGCYFALGDAQEQMRAYLTGWYGFDEALVTKVMGSPVTDAATARRYCEAFAEAGCDEFVFNPCSADRTQLDALADAVLG